MNINLNKVFFLFPSCPDSRALYLQEMHFVCITRIMLKNLGSSEESIQLSSSEESQDQETADPLVVKRCLHFDTNRSILEKLNELPQISISYLSSTVKPVKVIQKMGKRRGRCNDLAGWLFFPPHLVNLWRV